MRALAEMDKAYCALASWMTLTAESSNSIPTLVLVMPITTFLIVIGILNVPFWLHLSTTSPTPSTPKGKRLRNDFTAFMTVPLRLMQLCFWLHAAAESLSILSSMGIIPLATSEYLLLPDGHFVSISPLRAAAGLAVILGGFLRWRCFREMGAHFTFHVTVLEKHKLITTGPYAYVRHPSYSGGVLIDLGLWPWLFLPGSWATESSISASPWFWLVLAPCLTFGVTVVPMIFGRIKAEDEILMKQFGKEWEKWAKDVPYRLIPGVY
ncbi:hypothetical protein D9619_011939 [Psilocybe cf. subviscida]|uniref:Protein-S-isoprenylcysteine O-methyltransferase n=1 Tax=Psilocybe cf. subviscida TaxID=2480587 RepID=A0A8H5EW26_9AGAR|nr:hypothetical protein D9619_011939 [Psilocybe cf. subviscida]